MAHSETGSSVSADGPSVIAQNRFLLGTLTLGHLINDWVAGTIWIIAPAVAVSMGYGPAEIGIILAVNGIAAGLTYIPAGMIADRVSNQGFLMLISFWWVAAGYFVSTLVPGFWPITLLLAVGIMGDAFWHPVATGVLVKTLPSRRAQALGIHAMGGSIGAEILGPLSMGFLLGYFSWQTSLQLLIIPAVLMGLAFIFIAPKIATTSRSRLSIADLKKLARRWSSSQGLLMVGMMICYSMALFALLSMTPVILQQRYGFNTFNSSVVFAGMLVFGTLCQPFIGKISDIAGRKALLIGTVGLAAVCAAGAGLFSGFLLFVASLIGAASLLTAIRPVILAAAVEFSGDSESTTMGLVFAILDGVGALGALLSGLAGEIDLSLAFLLSAALSTASITLAMMLQFSKGTGRGGEGKLHSAEP